MNSKQVGEITEAAILARLLRLGYSASIPFGNNQRYDLIIDKGDGVLLKVQCKTGRVINGCVRFKASSVNGFTGKRSGYKGQVDAFVVYSPATDCVYEVPVSLVGDAEVTLRVEPPKGGSKSNIRWARDFQL